MGVARIYIQPLRYTCTISSPPINSPFIKSCGYVGQFENFFRPTDKQYKVYASVTCLIVIMCTYNVRISYIFGRENFLKLHDCKVEMH